MANNIVITLYGSRWLLGGDHLINKMPNLYIVNLNIT